VPFRMVRVPFRMVMHDMVSGRRKVMHDMVSGRRKVMHDMVSGRRKVMHDMVSGRRKVCLSSGCGMYLGLISLRQTSMALHRKHVQLIRIFLCQIIMKFQ
jgi:hypothetical protein